MRFNLGIVYILITGIIFTECGSSPKHRVVTTNTSQEQDTAVVAKIKQQPYSPPTDWNTFNKNAQAAVKEIAVKLENLSRELAKINSEEQREFTPAFNSLVLKNSTLKERLTNFNNKLNDYSAHSRERQEVLKRAFENAFMKDVNELLDGLRNFWQKEY